MVEGVFHGEGDSGNRQESGLRNVGRQVKEWMQKRRRGLQHTDTTLPEDNSTVPADTQDALTEVDTVQELQEDPQHIKDAIILASHQLLDAGRITQTNQIRTNSELQKLLEDKDIPITLTDEDRAEFYQLIQAGVINDHVFHYLLEKTDFFSSTEEDFAAFQRAYTDYVAEELGDDFSVAQVTLEHIKRKYSPFGNRKASFAITEPENIARYTSANDALTFYYEAIHPDPHAEGEPVDPQRLEHIGHTLYGRQWELMQQILILKQEAEPYPSYFEGKTVTEGVLQSIAYTNDDKISGVLADGFITGASPESIISQDGVLIDPYEEGMVVDRNKDTQLQMFLAQTKEIQEQYGMSEQTVFEIAKLIYQRTENPDWAIYNQMLKEARLEKGIDQMPIIPIGRVTVETGGGVCRHKALLGQVVFADLGFTISMVSGSVTDNTEDEGANHVWNEISVDDKKYIFDIQNPPRQEEVRFEDVNFESFKENGGWFTPRQDSGSRTYYDKEGNMLYSV